MSEKTGLGDLMRQPCQMTCAYCTLGPIPVTHLDSALFQIERQGWTVRFVVYSGHMQAASPIAMPGKQHMPPLPVYAVVAVLHYTKGDKVVPPVVDMSKPDAGKPKEGGADETNTKG